MTPDQPRIETPCPSCGSRNLFIGEGGHLTCSLIGCQEPGVERAIAALRATPQAPERCGFVHADGWTCGRAAGHPSVHVPPSRMATPPAPAPNYVHEMAELLRSACAIAERQGVGTAWKRFIESVYALGLNGVTARTYRVLPHEAPSPLGHQAGAANPVAAPAAAPAPVEPTADLVPTPAVYHEGELVLNAYGRACFAAGFGAGYDRKKAEVESAALAPPATPKGDE